MEKLLLVVPSIVFFGCAAPNYQPAPSDNASHQDSWKTANEKMLQSWIGSKKMEVVRQWGIPTRCMPHLHGEICEWSEVVSPETQSTYPLRNWGTGQLNYNTITNPAIIEIRTLEFDNDDNIISGRVKQGPE